MPEEFATYLEYTRNLRFDEDPDYRYMRWLFQNLFRREKFDNDGCFGWNVVKARPQWEVNERREERLRREEIAALAAGKDRASSDGKMSTNQPTDRVASGDVVLSIQSD